MTKALAVKQAIKDHLDRMAIVPVEQVQVTYGLPMRSPDKKWAVAGNITWDSTEWATNRSRNEAFSVQVIFCVQVAADKNAPQEAESFAIAMAAEFEQLVSADPAFGGLCITSVFTPRQLKSWPSDATTFEAQFDTEVRATCRP